MKTESSKTLDSIDRQLIKLAGERDKLLAEVLQGSTEEQVTETVLAEKFSRLILDSEINELPMRRILSGFIHELTALSLRRTKPRSVAYLGPDGSFSSIALRELFSSYSDMLPVRTIPDVFRAVERGEADYGVVPVENSTEGAVTFTLDELIETPLSINAEHFTRVTYSLLSLEENLSSVKTIYSHPQPLAQCKGWLRSNLPQCGVVSTDSTTKAAEKAAQERGAAAVASSLAAELYSLNVLSSGIEDMRQNFTRFFVVGTGVRSATGNDKTSIVCAIKDKPAALLGLLRPIAEAGINMTKIESRPDKKKMWEYNFFIDFRGHISDPVISEAIELIKKETIFLKILGSYPSTAE